MAHQIGPSSCQPPFAASDKTGLSVVLMWGSFAYRAKRCLAVMMVMVVMMMMVAVTLMTTVAIGLGAVCRVSAERHGHRGDGHHQGN
jgi:hypothetical protein